MSEAVTPAGEPAAGERDGPELPPACAAVRDALYRRVDKEDLAPAEAAALDAHLAACEPCAAELRRAGEFSTHVSRLLGGLRPAADMRRKILDRIGPLAGRRKTVIGAAALGGVALVGLLVLVLAGARPVARILRSEEGTRVLVHSAAGWRARPGAADVMPGERVEVADDGAELDAAGARIALEPGALVQLARSASGWPVVHCIRRANSVPGSMPEPGSRSGRARSACSPRGRASPSRWPRTAPAGSR